MCGGFRLPTRGRKVAVLRFSHHGVSADTIFVQYMPRLNGNLVWPGYGHGLGNVNHLLVDTASHELGFVSCATPPERGLANECRFIWTPEAVLRLQTEQGISGLTTSDYRGKVAKLSVHNPENTTSFSPPDLPPRIPFPPSKSVSMNL